MRRCGRAFCHLVVCLLVSAAAAAGAQAAPGGNGNHGKAHPETGKGLALAKGHAKHAVAAPQPSSAPASPAEAKGAVRKRSADAVGHAASAGASRGEERRAEHLTICHKTGSGRYIVISPSVTGATTGHLSHHDDFVYEGSCERPVEVPAHDPPTTGQHPPHDPPGGAVSSSPPHVRPSGDLPFTGLSAVYPLLAGLALVAAGLALTRRKPTA